MQGLTRDYLTFVVEPAVRKLCGPLFFTTSLQTASGNIRSNGSFGLINTGKKRLLVTCHHVWAEFQELRLSEPNAMFGVCLDMRNPIAIFADELLVDAEKRCDLVTFDMESMVDICSAGGLEFFNLHANRPPKINVDDVLFLIGFPGKGRVDEAKSVGFPCQAIGVRATQVGKFGFFAECSKRSRAADDLGGISGCPCFLLRDHNPMRLVGFATGYSNEGNRLQFTYVNYIQPDGTIQYMS